MPFHIVFGIKYLVSRSLYLRILNTKYRKSSGFTLIELLIAIVIIGVLATIGIYMSIGRVAQARDAVRKADLDQTKKILELVKSECKNAEYYPGMSNGFSPKIRFNDLSTYLIDPDLAYRKGTVTDPKNNSTYYYGYSIDQLNILNSACPDLTPGLLITGSKDYRLTAILENGNDPDIAKSQTKCPRGLTLQFQGGLTNPYPTNTYVVCPG